MFSFHDLIKNLCNKIPTQVLGVLIAPDYKSLNLSIASLIQCILLPKLCHFLTLIYSIPVRLLGGGDGAESYDLLSPGCGRRCQLAAGNRRRRDEGEYRAENLLMNHFPRFLAVNI